MPSSVTKVGGVPVQSFEEIAQVLADSTFAVDVEFINGENNKLELLTMTPENGKIGIMTVAVELE